MMPTQQTSLTSVTSDSSKGRRYVEICRAQYDKAGLDEESAQLLNEHAGFAPYLAAGIRQFSAKGPATYLETEVGGVSKDDLIADIEAAGMFISNYAREIMSKPPWGPGQKHTVKFARVKVRDLGFTKEPTTAHLWLHIKELGYSLCEPYDGPALRLAVTDQPKGDVFWTAMEQITDSGGRPRGFGIKRGSDGSLSFIAGSVPNGEWGLDRDVVFRFRP